MRKFVLVIDGEVGTDLVFEDQGEGPKFEANRMLAAALSSEPVILEVPADSPVVSGWTWDGSTFTPPQG
jgi:hypothetical protein